MKNKKNILLIGATGSIGTQTVDVVKKNESLNIVGLVAYKSKDKLKKIASELDVKHTLLLGDEKSQQEAEKKLIELINLDDVDCVVNAASGSAGLQASYSALEAGKTLILANKESLVVGGDLIMPLAKKQTKKYGSLKLIPVDSEHGAIFQCLVGEYNKEISKLHITASGGPFFGKDKEYLNNVTVKEALAHPTWNMGPKITIDSSTLMNKGLEVIEAHHLFDIDYEKINVLVHKQSIIHSMVEFCDGSIKAHLGATDMRIPIQYALSYPQRWNSPVEKLDIFDLKNLTFDKPDMDTFDCLKYAYFAGKKGGTLPCVMNAANEFAVDLFLNSKCNFLDIPKLVKFSMDKAIKEKYGLQKVESVNQLKEINSVTISSLCKYISK